MSPCPDPPISYTLFPSREQNIPPWLMPSGLLSTGRTALNCSMPSVIRDKTEQTPCTCHITDEPEPELYAVYRLRQVARTRTTKMTRTRTRITTVWYLHVVHRLRQRASTIIRTGTRTRPISSTITRKTAIHKNTSKSETRNKNKSKNRTVPPCDPGFVPGSGRDSRGGDAGPVSPEHWHPLRYPTVVPAGQPLQRTAGMQAGVGVTVS